MTTENAEFPPMNVSAIKNLFFTSNMTIRDLEAIDITESRILVRVPAKKLQPGEPGVDAVATMKIVQKMMNIFDDAVYTFRVREAAELDTWEFADVKPRELIKSKGMRLGELLIITAGKYTGKNVK